MGADGKPYPYLDKIEMQYVPESNTRVLGLKNGDYDAISTVSFNQAKSLEAGGDLVLEAQPIFRLDYVYLNHAKKPLDNKNIRLALNYAANREAILKAVYFGFGQVPNSYMPVVNFHSDTVPLLPYDIEKAKKLVQEAGYDGTPIKLMVDTGNAPFHQIATILQQGWGEAGLKTRDRRVRCRDGFDMTTKGDYQAYVSYITSDINDTDELATIEADFNAGTSAFFTWYNNAEVQKMLTEARSTSDEQEAGRALRQGAGDRLQRRLQRAAELRAGGERPAQLCEGLEAAGQRLVVAAVRLARQVGAGPQDRASGAAAGAGCSPRPAPSCRFSTTS